LAGCNNGIEEGFRENFITFRDSKLPDFLISFTDVPQKMQLLGAIKKMVSVNPCLTNAKWRETFTESTVTSPK